MADIDGSRKGEGCEADGGGCEPEMITGSAEVCDAGITGLRGQIDALLAGASAKDGPQLMTGREIDRGFKVVKNDGKRVNSTEANRIGLVLGDKFQLAMARVDGGGKVYVVEPRDVPPNNGRIDKRAERKRERAARHLRRTNPKLHRVD